jgi:hypothetical protein
MATKLPHLSRLVTRLIELGGAGLASAAGAFLFGQLAQPASPSQPLPPVQIIPASAELVQVMRKENALLIEQLLKEDGHRRDVEVVPSRPLSTIAPKPIKSVAPRREPKAEKPAIIESRARLEELQLPASRPLVNIAVQADARPIQPPSPNSTNGDVHAPAARPPVLGWFRSAGEGSAEVPRPPMPVGELQLRAM